MHSGHCLDVEGSRDAIRHRRFPHLTAGDVRLLDQLAQALGAAAAREFEQFIRSQHQGDAAFEGNVTPLSYGAMESIHGGRRARWSKGTGGGRRAATDDPRVRA